MLFDDRHGLLFMTIMKLTAINRRTVCGEALRSLRPQGGRQIFTRCDICRRFRRALADTWENATVFSLISVPTGIECDRFIGQWHWRPTVGLHSRMSQARR